ncbi:MAG: hypothetical protein ACP6IY_06570 [Promethearchaeia archaeon]
MKLYQVNEKGELNEKDKLPFLDQDAYIVDDDNTIYIWIGRAVSVNHKDMVVRKARAMNKERGHKAKLILLDQGQEYGTFRFLMEILKEGVPPSEKIEERGQFKLKTPEDITQKDADEAVDQINYVIGWLEQLKTYRGLTREKVAESKKIEEFTDEEPIITGKMEDNIIAWLNQLKQYRGIAPKKEEKIEVVKTTEPAVEEKIKEEPKHEQKVEKEEKPPLKPPEDLKPEINLAAYFLSKEGHSYDVLCWLLAEKQLEIQMSPSKPSEEQIRIKAEQIFHSSTSYDELCWLLSELRIYEKYGYFEMF